METLLANMKVLLNDSTTDNDALYTLFLEMAQSSFMDYCNRDDVPETAYSIIVEIALIKFNTRGAEGLSIQSFSGVSEHYLDEYPQSLKASMNRYRKVKLL